MPELVKEIGDQKIPVSCRLRLCKMTPVYEGPGVAEWEHKGKTLRMSGSFEVFKCKKCGRENQRMVNFK